MQNHRNEIVASYSNQVTTPTIPLKIVRLMSVWVVRRAHRQHLQRRRQFKFKNRNHHHRRHLQRNHINMNILNIIFIIATVPVTIVTISIIISNRLIIIINNILINLRINVSMAQTWNACAKFRERRQRGQAIKPKLAIGTQDNADEKAGLAGDARNPRRHHPQHRPSL